MAGGVGYSASVSSAASSSQKAASGITDVGNISVPMPSPPWSQAAGMMTGVSQAASTPSGALVLGAVALIAGAFLLKWAKP